jgi:protein involved in polysaccharide export with SLBB domain
MGNRVLLFLASAAVFVGSTLAQVTPVEPRHGYLVGPGDEITAKVLGEPQFDFIATVDQDGRIDVPFVDKAVDATCKTEHDLRVEVSKLLSKYLRSPQVNIRVTQRNSRPPVSVYGEVRGQAQQFNLTRKVYLLELISYAGGVTEKSNGMIQVFRTRPPLCGQTPSADWKVDDTAASGIAVPSRVYSLTSLNKGVEESNPEILPGDIIVVPKASPVYVIGEVLKPGEISIPEGGLPLTQAIALASGQTRDAKLKSIKIYRRKAGAAKPDEIVANLEQIKKGSEKDVMLQPFDIVEVGKAPKGFMDYLLEFATGIPGRIPIPIRPI